MATRLRSDPALIVAGDRAQNPAAEELQAARKWAAFPTPLPAQAVEVVEVGVRGGGYSAVADVGTTDADPRL